MSSSPVTNIPQFSPLHKIQFPSSKPVSRMYTIDQLLGTNKEEQEHSTVFVKSELFLNKTEVKSVQIEKILDSI